MYCILVTETRRSQADADVIARSIRARVHQCIGVRVLPPAGPRCLWTVQALFLDPGPGARVPEGAVRCVVLDHVLRSFGALACA